MKRTSVGVCDREAGFSETLSTICLTKYIVMQKTRIKIFTILKPHIVEAVVSDVQ